MHRYLSSFRLLTIVIVSLALMHVLRGQAPSSSTTKPTTFTRKEVTDILAENRRIVSDNGVEELIPLQINGTTQWVSVRGCRFSFTCRN